MIIEGIWVEYLFDHLKSWSNRERGRKNIDVFSTSNWNGFSTNQWWSNSRVNYSLPCSESGEVCWSKVGAMLEEDQSVSVRVVLSWCKKLDILNIVTRKHTHLKCWDWVSSLLWLVVIVIQYKNTSILSSHIKHWTNLKWTDFRELDTVVIWYFDKRILAEVYQLDRIL